MTFKLLQWNLLKQSTHVAVFLSGSFGVIAVLCSSSRNKGCCGVITSLAALVVPKGDWMSEIKRHSWYVCMYKCMYLNVLPTCICVHCMCAKPEGPEEGIRSPITEVALSPELPRGCWGLNSGLMQKELAPVILECSQKHSSKGRKREWSRRDRRKGEGRRVKGREEGKEKKEGRRKEGRCGQREKGEKKKKNEMHVL